MGNVKVKVPEGYRIVVPDGNGQRFARAGETVEVDQFTIDRDKFLGQYAVDSEDRPENPYIGATQESLAKALKKRDLDNEGSKKDLVLAAMKHAIPLRELDFSTVDGKPELKKPAAPVK